jgi:hypothetical protein
MRKAKTRTNGGYLKPSLAARNKALHDWKVKTGQTGSGNGVHIPAPSTGDLLRQLGNKPMTFNPDRFDCEAGIKRVVGHHHSITARGSR